MAESIFFTANSGEPAMYQRGHALLIAPKPLVNVPGCFCIQSDIRLGLYRNRSPDDAIELYWEHGMDPIVKTIEDNIRPNAPIVICGIFGFHIWNDCMGRTSDSEMQNRIDKAHCKHVTQKIIALDLDKHSPRYIIPEVIAMKHAATLPLYFNSSHGQMDPIIYSRRENPQDILERILNGTCQQAMAA